MLDERFTAGRGESAPDLLSGRSTSSHGPRAACISAYGGPFRSPSVAFRPGRGEPALGTWGLRGGYLGGPRTPCLGRISACGGPFRTPSVAFRPGRGEPALGTWGLRGGYLGGPRTPCLGRISACGGPFRTPSVAFRPGRGACGGYLGGVPGGYLGGPRTPLRAFQALFRGKLVLSHPCLGHGWEPGTRRSVGPLGFLWMSPPGGQGAPLHPARLHLARHPQPATDRHPGWHRAP